MRTSPLTELPKLGQSIWYDQMQRSLVTSGKLQKLIDTDDLRGLTSNPTIFEKAIGGSDEYDDSLAELAQKNLSREEIYESLVAHDIGLAADVFRSVYDKTKGLDGFVSLEVSPTLAHDTKGTIEEGVKLFNLLDRPNVMIKVPATEEGIPAIEELISRGINVNVTLIFSQEAYAKVIDAYLRGLERRLEQRLPLDRINSVASFFVSRIDTKVDAALEKKIAAATSEEEKQRLSALLGKIAIANAKAAYKLFKKEFSSERYLRLRDAGANVQRPLWASTGTKNPNYRDVLYIETLIGDNTVNTVPPQTYEAYREHGRVEPSLEKGMAAAEEQLAALEREGISLKKITDELTVEGVKSFADSFRSLLDTIESRRDVVLRKISGRESIHLGEFQEEYAEVLEQVTKAKSVTRIWKKDASLWKSDEAHAKIIGNSLGWVGVPEKMQASIEDVRAFAEESRKKFDHVVLLGMGGSSLCAEVVRRTFGRQSGWPELHVLDSTVPAAVLGLEKKLDLGRTLFIVASKSGSTIEPASFFKYFFDKVRAVKGDKAGENFIAITDPSTELERQSRELRFLRTFLNPSDIGGRYSALSLFGLVPAALAGIDVKQFLERGVHAQHACSDKVDAHENPGAHLGVILGTMSREGRDKMTLLTSASVDSLGLWIEQLIAESTGKEGKGIVPIAGEPLVDANLYGKDRFFVIVRMGDDDKKELAETARKLAAAGHPVVELTMRDAYDLADMFYVWEFATAVAGSLMQINPFDQPNVQESKDFTKELLGSYASSGQLPARTAAAEGNGLRFYSSKIQGASGGELIANLLSSVRQGDYFAITQYVDENAGHDELIEALRTAVLKATRAATTTGYGPRFLHSTGQLHKGGADNGVFLQITAEDLEDAQVPGEKFTFGTLKNAQAAGDFQALASRGRRAVSVQLGADTFAALRQLIALVEQHSTARV